MKVVKRDLCNDLYDTHTHSHLSCDSTASIAAMCEGAVANGLAGITITDHLDMNPNDEGYNFYRAEPFFEEIAAAKRTFAGKLKVLQGVEFGEPHLYPETLAVLHARPYDVIIGSIHWVDNDFPGSDVAHANPRAYFERYYAVMLAMVKAGGFDVFGHFAVPKRYLGVNVTEFPLIDEAVVATHGDCHESYKAQRQSTTVPANLGILRGAKAACAFNISTGQEH